MRTIKHIAVAKDRAAYSSRRNQRDQRGVALLLTIFGLLLLTGIAVAMMYSSDSETLIAVNYRDKEAATYAAMSALEEARDRLHPLYGDLALAGVAPTQLPTKNNAQVLYIVNPKPGEVVQPWNTANAYFDTELCQEAYGNQATTLNVAAGTVGQACGSKPPGNNWYAVYDNSANATKWKLMNGATPIPLDYKWVRVTLKADNMGPVYVQTPGNPAAGNQVCWNPNHQIQLPAGATTDCVSNTGGSVSSVSLVTDGTGYTSVPAVTISGGGGSGAAATAQVSTKSGGIASTALTSPGSGYTTSPTVTITNPDAGVTAATFKALVKGTPVTGVSMGSTNYCYPTGTTGLGVNFVPNPPPTAGGSASATVTMTGQACISGFAASTSCKSQKGNTLTISTVPGGTGSGFVGTVTLDNAGKIASSAITNVGSYTSVPATSQTVTVATCSISISYSGGIKINTVSLAGGGEYVSAPTATITGATPKAPNATQPTVNVTWAAGANNGQLNSVAVATAGAGYLSSAAGHYILSFTGGGGSGAAGNATSNATQYVSGLTLTNGGSGYTSAPTVTIGGPGSGATATAAITGGQQLYMGKVYMLTSLAVTKTGSRSMAQMEVGITPPSKFQLGGALTLADANPNFGTPNSNIFKINGNDAAGSGAEPSTCNSTPGTPMPSIGVYDSAAAASVIAGLGKPKNYIGAQSAPDVQVVAAADPNNSALTSLVTDISSQAGTVNVTGPATNSSVSNWGSATNLQTIVVNGDLTLSGNPSGYGILVVTGNLTMNGDFTWHGVVLVIGSAIVNNQGGGNGQITGAMYVANTGGTPSTFNWNGGGGNGIQYDHCWADDLLSKYPPFTSDQPLQVLSSRLLTF